MPYVRSSEATDWSRRLGRGACLLGYVVLLATGLSIFYLLPDFDCQVNSENNAPSSSSSRWNGYSVYIDILLVDGSSAAAAAARRVCCIVVYGAMLPFLWRLTVSLHCVYCSCLISIPFHAYYSWLLFILTRRLVSSLAAFPWPLPSARSKTCTWLPARPMCPSFSDCNKYIL